MRTCTPRTCTSFGPSIGSRVGRGALAVCVATFAAAFAAADDPPSADEKAIEEGAVKYVEAFNARDAKALAAMFDEQGRLEEADGSVFEGRAEIEETFAAAFEENPQAQLNLEMESLRFLTKDVALEQGSTGYFPDGETLTTRSKYVALHVRRGDGWKMASARSLAREVVSNYEYLRELEWLVGEWVDEGADSVVETSCRWDENKAFLLQDFQVRRAGEIVTKGTQRTGWDPQAKQFRSWIFDQEGGFGEGRWARVDDGWTIKVAGVSSDGENASATRTLTPVDKNRVILSITERLVGDERQPDVTITMVRKPPPPQPTAAGR